MIWKQMKVSGWGRSKVATVLAARPERDSDVVAAIKDLGDDTLIVHAAGRAYGDAAINDGGRVILTERLNRIVSFDPASGEVVCETGVTFVDLLRTFGPKGFLYPVSPGTAYTTVGGATAADVHGKNHESAGSFGNHVRWIDLVLANGEMRRVSPTEDPELFKATIGGMGLTGVMVRICFTMKPATSTYVRMREQRAANIEEFVEAFEACRHNTTYTAAWIDGASGGSSLGRGLIEMSEPADDGDLSVPDRRKFTVPLTMPNWLLNGLTVRMFNSMWCRRVPRNGRERRTHMARMLYVLDSILKWNRVYGKRGFRQFQCVIPDERAGEGLRNMLETVERSPVFPFLGVLKTLGGEGVGYLSFPMKGYTLALDFPNQKGSMQLLGQLATIVQEHRGRIYLAKDFAMSPESFREMYPKLEEFRTVLDRVDPEKKISSDLSRRLRIRD